MALGSPGGDTYGADGAGRSLTIRTRRARKSALFVNWLGREGVGPARSFDVTNVGVGPGSFGALETDAATGRAASGAAGGGSDGGAAGPVRTPSDSNSSNPAWPSV